MKDYERRLPALRAGTPAKRRLSALPRGHIIAQPKTAYGRVLQWGWMLEMGKRGPTAIASAGGRVGRGRHSHGDQSNKLSSSLVRV